MLRAARARSLAGLAMAGFGWARPETPVPRGTPRPQGERGQTLAEYALILGLIAVLAILGLVFMGGAINQLFLDPISKEFGNVLKEIFGP